MKSHYLLNEIKNNKLEELHIGGYLAGGVYKITESRDLLQKSLDFHVLSNEDTSNIIFVLPGGDELIKVNDRYSTRSIRPAINLVSWNLENNRQIAEQKVSFPGCSYSPNDYVTSEIIPKTNTLITAFKENVAYGRTYISSFAIDLKSINLSIQFLQRYEADKIKITQSDGKILIATGTPYVGIFSEKREFYELDVFNYDRWAKLKTDSLHLGGRIESLAFNYPDIFYIDGNRYDSSTKENTLRHQFRQAKVTIPGEYDKILKYETSSNALFCSKMDGSLVMIKTGSFHSSPLLPVDHIISDIQFDAIEHVNDVYILEHKLNELPQFVLAQTYDKKNERYYLYHLNLSTREKLGKIDLGHYPASSQLKDGRIIFRVDNVLATLSLHSISTADELNEILDALKENTSIKKVSITSRVLSRDNIDHIVQLKQVKSAFPLELPSDIEDYLNSKFKLEIIKGEKRYAENKIFQLSRDISHKMQQNLELQMELKRHGKQYADLCHEMTKLKKSSTKKIEELEEELQNEKQRSLKLQNKNLEIKRETNIQINELQKKLDEIAKDYEGALLQLSDLSVPSTPLIDTLSEMKELSLDVRLKLLDPAQNIEFLSLIRWAEDEEIKLNENDLLSRGAILSIEGLLANIQKMKTISDEKRLRLLVNAIDQLLQDFKEKSLPRSILNEIESLVIMQMKKNIHSDQDEWLKNNYLIQIDLIKNNLLKKYFTEEHENSPTLDAQFKHAIQLLSKTYSYYDEFFNDNNILSKIRVCNDDQTLNFLRDLIKNKMDARQIEITKAQHDEALEKLFTHLPAEKLEQCKHDKIIHFFQTLIQELNLDKTTEQQSTHSAFHKTFPLGMSKLSIFKSDSKKSNHDKVKIIRSNSF